MAKIAHVKQRTKDLLFLSTLLAFCCGFSSDKEYSVVDDNTDENMCNGFFAAMLHVLRDNAQQCSKTGKNDKNTCKKRKLATS